MQDIHAIPGPPPVKGLWQILKMIRKFSTDPIGMFTGMFQAYGPTVRMQVEDNVELMTTDPDVIYEVLVKQAKYFQKDKDYTDPRNGLARFMGNGLVTSNGEFWRRQRKLVAPSLHVRRIASYADYITHYTTSGIDAWQDGARLDISREMNAITMRVIGRSLFNVEVEEEIQLVGEAMEIIQRHSSDALKMVLPAWLPTPLELKARRANTLLNGFIYEMIAERRKDNEDKGDLLSMLMLSEDEDGNSMSDIQVRDEAVTLFLAGHETTANAMNWTWVLLAQHPEVEAKLHEELDRVLGGRTPILADLDDLPYTEMVVKESMRVYPPVWGYSRESTEDLEINGYQIPAGTKIAIYAYGAHRNPQLWDDPERFDPERFSAENEPNIPKYAYVPFAGGPRICIGNAFAMMEARLMLATIAQRYTLSLAPGQVVEMNPKITLNPRHGLPMTVHARQPRRISEKKNTLEHTFA